MLRRAMVIFLCALMAVLTPYAKVKADPQIFTRGDRSVKRIAITMDDCGNQQYVNEMMDLCDQYGFKMTFFPIGNRIDESEAADWQRMVESGHEIGNHTLKHARLTKKSTFEKVEAEMQGMEERLNSVLGYEYKIKLMRPPFGSIYGDRLRTAKWLEQCGYPYIILWSISQTDPQKMLAQVQNGDILLYHSYRKDVDGLKKAIPVLLERGYELVTVSELLGLNEKEAMPTLEMQKNGVKMEKTTCHVVQNMLR